MKKLNFLLGIFILLVALTNKSFAQGGTACSGAAPFCTGTTYSFDNNINTSSQAGPNYGCLFSQPNPSWYYLEMATAGNIDISIGQTTGPGGTGTPIDVDFIMYGPFTSATGGCASGLTAANTVDCSYSAAATETANIVGATVGQYYLLLLTNYSNQNGYITFSQTGGAGATNCAVVSGCTATINNGGPFCAGSPITMSCTPQAGATNYSWTGPGGFSQSGAGLTSVSIPGATGAMAGTYTLTITRSPGTPCVLTTVVVVNTITATFTTPNATQCLTGNNFSFTHTGTAGSTHTWNFGGATVNTSTSATPTGVTYAAAGTYVITHVATKTGCSKTQTMSVTVNPMPALTGSPINASCGANNGSIVINNTSGGGQGPFSFTNNGTAVGSQTITGLAPGTYTIGITNTFGCTFTTPITVGTNPGPTNITLTPTNASCGLSNGSFTFGSPVGGTGPYNYAFNGGAFTAVSPMTGLAAGTYSITVKDVNGCLFTKTVVISNSTGPTAIAGTTAPTGCGMANGSYTITGTTGGTPTYSYNVDGGAFSGTTAYSALASGTHSVSVKDVNGCIFNTTFVIGGAAGPSSGTVTTTNASCGSANGSATVTGATGGSTPYQYSFDGSPFAATTTTAGLSAGIHTLTVKDVGGCTLPITYNILNTGSPTASVTSSVNVSCFGGTNGSFTVTPVGGTGPSFTYTLATPFQTNGTGQFSGLPPGTYNITVKDQAGCVTTTSVALSQPTALTLTATAVGAKCFGTATGTINLTGAGGSPTYSYNLNSGTYQTSPNFINEFAGIYTMGIKDANGCTASQTVQVTQPAALNITTSTQNANCTAANGVASTTVTGGTGSMTYTWSGGGGSSAVSNGVVAGTYTVIAADANGCTITAQPVIGLTPGGTAAITASTNITCNGANNGNLTASMTGGTPNFTYTWSGGQTTAMATGLSAGTYTCVITDNYGCVASTIGTLTQPTLLTAVMNSNNVKCFGTSTGTVTAAGSGGTFPYTYLWTSLASTLATVPNVAIGTHTCNITDANGCTITQTIGVTQPSSVTITSTVTAATCNQANGSTTITAAGGTPAYTYSWSTGSTASSITNQLAGTYTVEVKDANNCTQILAATIPNSSGPSISISTQTNVSCFGGNNGVATTAVAGGTPTYTYTWSGGGQVTPTATNLLAGIHTVTVTDANGCVASTSVNITQPTALTVNLTATNPKCFGALNGYGSAIALGGTPGAGYTYTWTGGGGNTATSNLIGANVYGLTVADANGCTVVTSMTLTNPPAMVANITSTNVTCFNVCNGIAVGTVTNNIGVVSYYWTGGPSAIPSQTATGLCAGTYTLLATDQNNCTAGGQVTITQPTQVTATISSTGSVTCNGGNNGFAAVTAGGGIPTYSYTWSGGASASGNSSNANTLTAGVYVVTVSDQNLCTATATATIIEPTPLATTLTTTNVKCNGGSDGTGNIAYLGGAGTTTFLWSPGLQTGNPVNNLLAGPQTVTITSNGSCPAVLSFTLTEPAALTAVVSSTNSNCSQNNGKTCAVVGGGTSPLITLWSNNISTLCNNNVFAGPYTFTVTDFNGCVAIASGLVNDIAGPVVSITSQTNVSCFNGSNGAATSTLTGGVAPYGYAWIGTPYITPNLSNVPSGLYNLQVTDDAGCIGTASVNITQPTQLVSAIGSYTDVSCFGLSNGDATLLANGGTGTYSYSWSPSGQTNSVLTNVPMGVYTGTVRDVNGCTTTSSLTISEPQALVMAASSFSNISCFGASNGQISTTVQGGTPGYTYIWLPAQSGNNGSIGGLPPGPHVVTVTDTKSCSINASFNITEPSALTSTYTALPATCGNANGSATVTVNGGTPIYSLSWNTNPVTVGNIASNLAPGTSWSCLITDNNGCSITQTVGVIAPPVSAITGFSVTPPKCFGLQNGEVTINYTAGTGPYTVTWSNPISQTITTAALTQSIVGVGAGAYSATVTDSYNCSTSQPVIVSQPSLLILSPMIDPKICYGQSAQIYATGQNGTPAYSYTWSPTPFVGGGPHTVSPTVTTTYSVTVSDVNGCSPPLKIITVQVTPQLIVTPTVITVCHGVEATLTPTFTSSGNGGPYTYVWSPGSASTSSINVIGNNISAAAITNTYSVMVDDGCTIPNSTAIFTVNVNPLPVIDFTATPSGCAPLTVTLTGISNHVGDTFDWSNGVIGTGNPQIVTLSDSGKYTISLLVTNSVTGCSQDTTKVDYIEVYPLPIASFYADPQSASILDPTINFINTSQGATSYYWDFGDPEAISGTNTSIVTNPNHTYGFVGTYIVNLVATSIKGCKDTANIMVEILPDYALYIPNTFTPDGNGVNDIFQPLGVGIDEDNYRMDIYDRWGENIFTSNAFRKGWDGTVKGGSKMAEQGVYTYKLMVKDTLGNKHPYVGHVTVIKKEN